MTLLYLKDAVFVDSNSLDMQSGHLAVEIGPGGDVSFVNEIPSGVESVDCGGRLVTKALANGHHHAYSALARGMPAPPRTPTCFVDILYLIWWNLDKHLDEAMIRASALATAVEAARCGCTFVIDHHSSPNAAQGSLEILAEAFDQVGVSHLLCYELSDRDGQKRLTSALEATEAYLESRPGLVGLHASFTVSNKLLDSAMEIANRHQTGIHIHVAEANSDEEHSRVNYGMSVGDRLKKVGALELPKTILAHCLHLDDAQRSLVRESQAWVAQNTESNQNNNVGRFDPKGLGDRVFLGTDGMHSDMFHAVRASFLQGQAVGGLTPIDAYRRLRRVHDYLSLNSFAGDSRNNLMVLDYPSPTPVTSENFAAHFVYGLGSQHVHTVISEGQVIVEAGRVTRVDQDGILADARIQAERLWQHL
jgi:cytosine/adenosine deaminase-related metal-dependent hydrolase